MEEQRKAAGPLADKVCLVQEIDLGQGERLFADADGIHAERHKGQQSRSGNRPKASAQDEVG